MGLRDTVTFAWRLPLYIGDTVLFGGSVAKFWYNYFSSRRYPPGQQYYVSYTELDHAIPFKADSISDYWLIYFRLFPVAAKLGDEASARRLAEIRSGFVELAREAAAAFRAVPNIMPQFCGGTGNALKATQFLKPINCCPSLHTAGPAFACSVGSHYFPKKAAELCRNVGGVVSAIIGTKLHSLLDVAFGLVLARQVTEKLGLEFLDLEEFFLGEQKQSDGVPYEHIYRMYHDICAIAKEHQGSLPDITERYFKRLGLPSVRREESNCYYHLKNKTLVYPKELEVGSGLL